MENQQRQTREGAPTTLLQGRTWEKPVTGKRETRNMSPGKVGWVVLLVSLSALGVGLARELSSASHPTDPVGISMLFAWEGEIHQCLKM